MSGRITIHNTLPNQYAKHDHVVIIFTDKTTLIFNDARRFGMMLLCPTKEIFKHKLLKNIGPEPLAESFDGKELFTRLQNKNIDMKAALMDQRVVAGLGNIYVCEALFNTGISPTKKAKEVSLKKVSELIPNIKSILESAIESGGSTLRDYVQATGDMGYFQHKFKVYGRENEPCIKCKNSIERIVQAGRSTFYCKICQK
jgi:formamidopyrimidine-DNA glycosylase